MEQLKIIAGNSNPELAQKIASEISVNLSPTMIKRFADGEIQIEIHDNVRGADVYIIQSTCPPSNENYMELFILIDALKRASAARITAVMPYYGYSRQDRKVAPRAPISAKLMADLLTTAGANRVVSIDLHAGQIQGFFNVPVDHLFSIPSLARAWREEWGFGDDFVVVSPDAGGVERARAFAKRLEAPIAIIDKRRTGPNEAKAYNLIGEVKGKFAVIIDDMIDTAGTLTQAAETIMKNGATRVAAVTTHPVLSGPAIQRIQDSPLEFVVVTDTIPLKEAAQQTGKYKVISVAPVIAEAIKRIHDNESVSSLFI